MLGGAWAAIRSGRGLCHCFGCFAAAVAVGVVSPDPQTPNEVGVLPIDLGVVDEMLTGVPGGTVEARRPRRRSQLRPPLTRASRSSNLSPQMTEPRRHLLLVPLLAALAACASDPPPDCVPSEDEWDASIAALVDEHCGTCHGETPEFGAPFSLLDYDANVRGREGDRHVDRMVHMLAEGLMPPTGAAQPALSDRDRMAAWASCGTVRVEDPVGLDANRPVFVSPSSPPTGLTELDLTADNLVIGPDETDRYVELDFADLVEEDMFIRRFDVVLDDTRVVHHFTLRRGDPASPGGFQYLYAWAPGTGPFEFPDGGVRLTPTDTLRLQIHYNNGAGYDDVSDSSGVKLYVTPPEGPEYVMVDPGPGAAGFSIPPRSESTEELGCEVQQEVQVLATMPHMHEIGTGFELDLVRDGDTTNLLRLNAWDFETQLFYDLPIDLVPGDELIVRCDFENASSGTVSAGPRTEDEMCYAFTYVTPPMANFCSPGPVGELVYTPGECVLSPLAEVPVLTGTVTGDAPTFDADGVIPEGAWTASRLVVVSDMPDLVRIATFTAAGQLQQEGDQTIGDGSFHIIAPIGDLREGAQFDLSWAGTLDAAGVLTASCGGVGDEATFGTVDGVPAMRLPLPSDGMSMTGNNVFWVFYED